MSEYGADTMPGLHEVKFIYHEKENILYIYVSYSFK